MSPRQALLTEHSGPGFDKTSLRYWTRRAGDRWLLICTGYGGTLPSWQPLLDELDERWSVLLWDYRGQFGSSVPDDDLPIKVEDHSRDLDALMAAESIHTGVVMGWSVGVQVALEHYRRRRRTVEGLVLINGAYERVLHSPMGEGLGADAMRGIIRTMGVAGGPLQTVLRPLLHRRITARVAKALRFVKPEADLEHVQAAITSWRDMDVSRYMAMTLTADEHSTEDMLDTVRVPTLITAGDQDFLTPPLQAERLHQRIADSEYQLFEGTTHYAIMEKPTAFARVIDEFLARRLAPSRPG
jgi:pimeloyl-ACP methyl ester carboxylesterase